MVWGARIYLLIYLIIITAAVISQVWLIFLFVFGPRIYGAPLVSIVTFTQHAGLADNVYDHRLNTRTVYMNPILCFLYCNMNYHLEHHMYPTVPFYSLPKLHQQIKSQTPVAYNGLYEAYKEMIPTFIRQQGNPEYFVTPKLPEKATFTPDSISAKELK